MKLINRLYREGHQIQIWGPLIHNQTVLDDLAAKGIGSISSIRQIDRRKTLVIRSHGIPKELEAKLKSDQVRYIDATCPLVKRGQQIIGRFDQRKTKIVIVGDRHHPEIIAAQSYCRGATVINSLAEAEVLPFSKRMTVVAQTTLDVEFFNSIITVLLEKAERLEIFNTICQATKVRQNAVKKLAPRVDCVVVVGGRNSSNTKKLIDIARRENKNILHIETSSELAEQKTVRKIKKFTSIGITAGASTPPEEIERVKKFLVKLKVKKET